MQRENSSPDSKRTVCAILIAVSLLLWTDTVAALQQDSANQKGVTESCAADRAGEIPLRIPAPRGSSGELWVESKGSCTVRNVTAPTLTPVLPDPSKATGVGMIIAPGGAFLYLEMDAEGYNIARRLADRGIAAFVLKYRTDPTSPDPNTFHAELMKRLISQGLSKDDAMIAPPAAIEDAIAAVHLVRSHAKEWGVDPNRIGLIGFSAGAIATVSVGLVEDKSLRPDFIAPFYASMAPQNVPSDAPPAFFAIALDDRLFGVGRSIGLIDSWRKAGRPVEAHLYMKGGHGFAGGPKTKATALWLDELYAWMSDLGLFVKPD
jgi:acetyl esterase/lipase